MANTRRLLGLDVWRGVAVVLMIVYHFFFDLNYFNYLDLHMNQSPIWRGFRYGIIGLFLLVVGVSLFLAHQDRINWQSFGYRLFILGLAALLVSVGSWTQFPDSWIYFGILHFIWLASILGLPLVVYPKWLLTTIVMILLIWLNLEQEWGSWLFSSNFFPERTEDFVPLVPWLSVVLLGIWLGVQGKHRALFADKDWHYQGVGRMLGFLGRHALWVYLTHQLLLFAFFIALGKIL